jgi:CRISPR-associated protein Csx3
MTSKTSYTIELLNRDTLKVGFNLEQPALGDRIVKDAETCLEELIQSGKLKGGSVLKIDGRISLPVSYTIAHKLGHLYSAIALSDTRLKAYVVVISTNPEYQIGDRIDIDSNVKSNYTENQISQAFLINSEENLLKVGFNSQVQANGDQIVIDTVLQLDKLISSGKLRGGKLLKINGRASALASCVIASKVAHLYGAIAVFEPKDGDNGLDRYIVTISHSSDYRVGDTLDFESTSNSSVKVVLCGSPHTGKTVLRDGLKKAIREQLDAPDDFFYVVSGCPDGDYPAWIADTAINDLELAEKLRKDYKAKKFTPELAQAIARGIKVIENPLLLFDVGGKITPENEEIMCGATHAIILAPTGGVCTKLKGFWQKYQWQRFCQKLNLIVVAIIYSDYRGKEDKVYRQTPLFKGSVHYLERGKDVSSRPTIQALARSIVNLINQGGN